MRVSLLRSSCVLPLVLALFAAPSNATVLTGPLTNPAVAPVTGGVGITENWAISWGDGSHDLRAGFSSAYAGRSGWFYGSGYNFSDADVYDAGRVDPLIITDATRFAYTRYGIQVQVGDTVFFHGTNNGDLYGDHRGTGYYGAWQIDSFAMLPYQTGCVSSTYSSFSGGECVYTYIGPDPNPKIASLDGRWYFQTDQGSGNFTTSAIPEPSSALLFMVGLLVSLIAGAHVRDGRHDVGLAGWRRARA